MTKKTSSMQTHGAIANANNSVDAATNALSQVMSHPSATMVSQAENAIQKADRAVAQARRQEMDNPLAAKKAAADLDAVKDEMEETKP